MKEGGCLYDPCYNINSWNQVTGLLNYAYLLNTLFKDLKFKSGFGPGIIIDTGRNGSPLPAELIERGKVLGTQLNKPDFSGVSPCGSWCNVLNSTVGEKPTTNTAAPYIHAYMWLKTPGESDGCVSTTVTHSPKQLGPSIDPPPGSHGNYSGKACVQVGSNTCARYDGMCGIQWTAGSQYPDTDPGYEKNKVTAARLKYCPPTAGAWDPLQILQLANADYSTLPPKEYK